MPDEPMNAQTTDTMQPIRFLLRRTKEPKGSVATNSRLSNKTPFPAPGPATHSVAKEAAGHGRRVAGAPAAEPWPTVTLGSFPAIAVAIGNSGTSPETETGPLACQSRSPATCPTVLAPPDAWPGTDALAGCTPGRAPCAMTRSRPPVVEGLPSRHGDHAPPGREEPAKGSKGRPGLAGRSLHCTSSPGRPPPGSAVTDASALPGMSPRSSRKPRPSPSEDRSCAAAAPPWLGQPQTSPFPSCRSPDRREHCARRSTDCRLQPTRFPACASAAGDGRPDVRPRSPRLVSIAPNAICRAHANRTRLRTRGRPSTGSPSAGTAKQAATTRNQWRGAR